MDDLERVRQFLRDVEHRKVSDEETSEAIRGLLRSHKIEAVRRNDQEMAKLVWCYEQILLVQSTYLSAFGKLKDHSFYEAWCLLERVEIELGSLEQHFKTDTDEYRLALIEKHCKQFQSLFPYKYFASPTILQVQKVCSICNQPVSIRSPCGHRVGEIYNGEMCCRIVTEADFLELSVVENPVQKYSVLFMSDAKSGESIDHYKYDLVQHVVDGLHSAFDPWDMYETKIRHPHEFFKHVGRNEACPCGSGAKYKHCCLKESGVLRPHIEVGFSVPPPDHMKEIKYIY